MPAITASMVGALRAKTDAPMMECKKALTEADGDMDRAEEILRVKLGSKAGKAASRVTAEGVLRWLRMTNETTMPRGLAQHCHKTTIITLRGAGRRGCRGGLGDGLVGGQQVDDDRVVV